MNLKKIFALNKTKALYLALLVICGVFCFTIPAFPTYRNITAILRQITVIGICGVGMTFVKITGGVDLSVGSMISVTGVIIAMLNTKAGVPLWMCLIIAVIACAFMGFVNGIIVAKGKLIALIVTMATGQVVEGVIYTVTNGMPIGGIDPAISFFGQGYIGFLQFPIVALAVCVLSGNFLLNRTYIGRHIYACGGNEESAKLSGIHVDRVKILCYVLCGVFCAIAGIIMLGRVNNMQPNTGLGDEKMNVMTATMLGGASLAGGGSVMGTLAGVLIIGVLNNGLLLMGFNQYLQTAAKGLVLLIAICFDPVQNWISEKMRVKKYMKEHNLK